ncbi:hypothetical protein TNCV_625001 [Trichonephila clavipes]|nr:hypothetical protein TNCV_625001 [Trichonephila clavipes]
METTNHLRTCGREPLKVGENRDSISRQEDDKPNKGSGQTNAGIWSTVVAQHVSRLRCVATSMLHISGGRSDAAIHLR